MKKELEEAENLRESFEARMLQALVPQLGHLVHLRAGPGQNPKVGPWPEPKGQSAAAQTVGGRRRGGPERRKRVYPGIRRYLMEAFRGQN